MRLFSKKSLNTPRRRQNQTGDSQAASGDHAQPTFMRNRTLTGSLSSNVSSSVELQAGLQSPRTHVHHLSRRRRKLTSAFVGVVGACVLLAWLLYELTAFPSVRPIDGSVAFNSQRYVAAINDYFGRHPFERLRFMLNTDQLNDFMHHELPEVVSMHQEGFSGVGATEFSVVLRRPTAGWLIGSKQYYVDATGVSFQVNYYETPPVRIVDQSGVEQTAGTAIASSRFLTFVGRAVSASADYHMVVEQAIIPRGTTRQVQLVIKDHSYPIKLSLDRPVGEQIEDMLRAVSYFDAKGVKPAYIDVRVSGRAFYK